MSPIYFRIPAVELRVGDRLELEDGVAAEVREIGAAPGSSLIPVTLAVSGGTAEGRRLFRPTELVLVAIED